MTLELPLIPDAERTPLIEVLLAIIDTQQQRIQQLEETVQKLRDEINLLKGELPRPKIAPSRLESPPPKPPPAPADKRPGSAKRSKNASFLNPVEVKISFPDPPPVPPPRATSNSSSKNCLSRAKPLATCANVS